MEINFSEKWLSQEEWNSQAEQDFVSHSTITCLKN